MDFSSFSLNFSKHFILVRAKLDPEPILGTLGVRLRYTLDGTSPSVHQRVAGKPENPDETHTDTGRTDSIYYGYAII